MQLVRLCSKPQLASVRHMLGSQAHAERYARGLDGVVGLLTATIGPNLAMRKVLGEHLAFTLQQTFDAWPRCGRAVLGSAVLSIPLPLINTQAIMRILLQQVVARKGPVDECVGRQDDALVGAVAASQAASHTVSLLDHLPGARAAASTPAALSLLDKWQARNVPSPFSQSKTLSSYGT